MRNKILGGMTSLLLPFAAYGAPLSYGYQRKAHAALSSSLLHGRLPTSLPARPPKRVDADMLAVEQGVAVRELVVMDAGVRDRENLARVNRPGVEVVEIASDKDGLAQLIDILAQYRNLSALHIISHAEEGVLLLGNTRISSETLQARVEAFSSLNGALKPGADLMLYGCNLAAGEAGEAFLDIVQRNTHLDIAASTDLTGNADKGGDWELEIARGEIDADVPFSEKALRDFSEVLAPNGTKTFASVTTEVYTTNPSMTFASDEFAVFIDSNMDEIIGGINGGACIDDLYVSMFDYNTTSRFYVRSEPSGQNFAITQLILRQSNSHSTTGVNIEGFATVASTTPIASKNSVSLPGAQAATTVDLTSGITGSFANIQKLRITPTDNVAFCINSITFAPAVVSDTTPPAFQNSTPSISDTTTTGTTLTVRLNEIGTAYYVVVADGAAAPTTTQVRNGQNSSGAAALASGSISVASAGADYTSVINTLSAGTSYDIYVVAQDDEGTPNVQATTTLVNLTTPSRLERGDMVVLGWDAIDDLVTFATLVDIPAGTVIKITDRGWDQATNAFTASTTGDGVVTWTTSGTINAGSVFTLYLAGTDGTTTLTNVTTNTNLTANTTVSGFSVMDPMNLVGDSIFLYQDSDANPHFIFGMNSSAGTVDGTNWNTSVAIILRDSMIPNGTGSQNSLTNGTHAVGLPGGASQQDNVQYNGSVTTADKATWLARVSNVANWTGDNTGTATTSVGISSGSSVTIGSLDSDASLTAAGSVTEPVGLGTTIDTLGEAVDVFDFTISDGGSSDGLATTVSQIVVNVSGTSTDTERGQITWRLNGPDVGNVTGTYNSVSDTITFSGLSISVANGGNETYTVNAYYNNTSNLTEDHTIILSVDGDTNLTVGGGGTQMGSSSPVTNGAGSTIDVITTELRFTTQPTGSVSGSALSTQPVVVATDAFGNIDVDFTETITLTEASAGSLTNNTQAATAGVATFTSLIYTATADQQAFTLTANDQDGVGSDLPTRDANSVTSDVVATRLIFSTQPSPTTLVNGAATSLTTVPVVAAVDADGTTDTGYSTNVVLSEVNGAGLAALSATGDGDGASDTVTLTPSSGVATFTGMQVTYAASGNNNETFNLRASSGGLTTADSTQFTAVVAPTVSSVSVPANGTYRAGDSLSFTVNTSEAVTVSGTPRIALTIGLDTAYATYASGSGTTALVFTYTVVAGDLDSNGIAVAVAIDANGGTLQDSQGNSLNLALNSVGSTASVLVDAVVPTISSVNVPANDTYVTGETLSFTVNASENITVTGAPTLPLTVGGIARQASVASGSGSTALVFSYTVQPGDSDPDGIQLDAAISLNGGTLRDAAGNDLTLTLNSVASTAGVLVDAAAPSGHSVSFDDSIINDAEADSISFTFASAEVGATYTYSISSSGGGTPVTGTGTVAAAAEQISGIDVSGLSDGTLTLSVNLTDAAGNAASAVTDTAVLDGAGPTASIVVADSELLTGETSSVTITFNEAVSDFTNGDLTVVNGSLTAVSTADSGVTWTATLTPAADTYVVDNVITLDNAGVTDAGGNAGSGTTDSNSYTVRTRVLTLSVTSNLDTGDDATTAATLADDETDGNGLSLREALFWARSNGDTITFDLDNGTAGNQGGTITLNGTELAVNQNNLIIDGDLDDNGMPDVTLSGNNVSRIMRVTSGHTGIELVGLTLSQGAGNGGGGGLALDVNTHVTLRDSIVTDNHELGWGGGGIYGSTATLRLINSAVSGNSSDSFGGGIRLVGNGVLHLINSTVSNNITSGAGGHGAGIQYAGPDLLVVNSTISGNVAMGAGAIGGGLRISSGVAAVYSATIVGNAAADSGGGVSANGTNDVFVNTVVAGNTAGAGATAGAGGSPLATGGSASDVAGTIEVATNSYFGTSATITTDNNSLNNQGTLNLLLGNLADNGGRVLTHRPQAGSALSDAGSTAALPTDTYDLDGDSNVAEALPVDALGETRVSGTAVDIGAVEGNRAPVLMDLSGGNTHIEDGVAVWIDNDVTVTDDELDTLNGGNGNYSGASVTIARSGGVDATDTFGFLDGSGMSLVAGEILKNGQAIATFDTATAGQLVVTYTDANGELPERSDVNAMMQQITYATASGDPATSVVLDWTFADEAGASVTETASVTISLTNDAPVVTAAGGTPTFTEGGSAVDLFSSVSINPVEAAQSIIGLQLTVTGVNNGSNEILTIDGTDVALTQGNVLVTATNGLDVSVTVAGNTATVTLSHATGITGAAAQAIIDAMTYRNTSGNPSSLSRTVTLASVQDNGGVANDGVDSTVLSIAATVTISAVNNAPTISGTPLVTTNQSALYSFTPTASDLDSGTLTFSVSNAPVWASFDTSTGTLSGIPAQAHVGTTTGIVITVSDGALSASLPAFNLTVVNVNDAPVISGTPATSVDQDVAYSFVPTASDLDNDALTFSATNLPAWASLNTATGAITGTPDIDDVGEYANIVITVSDGALTASLPAFTITVQNNAPVISGTPQLTAYVAAPYSFTPTASDGDNDTLTFTATGLPGWLFLNTATGQISGTPGVSDAGMSYNIALTVSDGIDTATLPVFSLSVQYDGDEPVVTPPDEVTLNAVGLLTPISLSQLLSLPPNTSAEAVQEALRNLASDRTHGGDCCITEPLGLQGNQIMLAPGRHEVIWRARNQANLTGEALQVVNVLPLISLNKDQVRGEGSTALLRVLLNGRSPVYPLTVGFTVGGTATGADHDLAVTSVTFAQGEIERQVQINLTDDGIPEGSETLIISLDENGTDAGYANFGNKRVHEIQIVEENVAPLLRLNVQQNGEDRRIITQDGGVVQISAIVDDPNPADTHLYDWQYPNGFVVTPVTDASGTFDPAALEPGIYEIGLTVTEDSVAPLMTRESVRFQVIESAPALGTEDSDNDGVDDATEGLADSDGDGQPDYVDSIDLRNVLNETRGDGGLFLVEGDPGVRMELGEWSLLDDADGAQVSRQTLTAGGVPMDSVANVGGYFDFVVRDIPAHGSSVRIVLPQRVSIPTSPVYRKFAQGVWFDFVENARNQLSSAAGSEGVCPPPGSDEYSAGLNTGYWCVQLTIEDGGPNDADGEANGTVVDPGGVAGKASAQNVVEHKTRGGGGSGGSIGVPMLAVFLLLMLIRLQRARKPALGLAALLLVISSNVNAQSAATPWWDDLYVQGGIAYAHSNLSRSDAGERLGGADDGVNVTDMDDKRMAWNLGLGYSFSEQWALEMSYLDLGEVEMTFDAPITAEQMAQIHPESGKGLALSGIYLYPLQQHLWLQARLGLFSWEQDYETVRTGDRVDRFSDSGTDLLWGLGIAYQVVENITITGECQIVDFDNDATLSVGAGIRLRFE